MSTNLTHASIIPLIGGETIGSERAFGKRPEYFLSYSPFSANDSHIVNWYENEVEYLLLDQGARHPKPVNVVSAVCPCAGLSQMSFGFGDHNPNNKWMETTAEYVLSEMKPDVFWGENAPGFASNIGKNIREKLRLIAEKNGYTMSVYRTRSLLHGQPQIRERSFYFFWRGTKTPLLGYFNRPHRRIEDVIMEASKANSQQEPINTKTPSRDDIHYRFVLEDIHGGMSHRDFVATVDPAHVRRSDSFTYIQNIGVDLQRLADWLRKNGHDKEADKTLRKKAKLETGKGVMRRGTMIPKDYIGAFVGHYPTMLTHPVEDRYITYREAMSIMGLPENFELLNQKKSVNHICQNVPVQTAQDMAEEVVAALEGRREWLNAKYLFQRNHDQTHRVVSTSETAGLDEFISA